MASLIIQFMTVHTVFMNLIEASVCEMCWYIHTHAGTSVRLQQTTGANVYQNKTGGPGLQNNRKR